MNGKNENLEAKSPKTGENGEAEPQKQKRGSDGDLTKDYGVASKESEDARKRLIEEKVNLYQKKKTTELHTLQNQVDATFDAHMDLFSSQMREIESSNNRLAVTFSRIKGRVDALEESVMELIEYMSQAESLVSMSFMADNYFNEE